MGDSKYVWSTTPELFTSEMFESREDAVADACNELSPGEGFMVGEVVSFRFSDLIEPHTVIELAQERLDDEAGEAAEMYEPKPSAEAHNELKLMLDAWASRHDMHPSVYAVGDVTDHSVPEQD